MPDRLEAIRTTASTSELATAFYNAWYRYWGNYPSESSVCVLLSQWALETGWGKSMWCYNIGNVKSRKGDGYDYYYVKCNEILSAPYARKLLAQSPDLVNITSFRDDGKCIVWFSPDHPACRFRGFKDLQSGAMDHMVTLVNRFSNAWDSVREGDAEKFSKRLKTAGYYTADEHQYTASLKSVFKKLIGVVKFPEVSPMDEATEKLKQILLIADGIHEPLEKIKE